MVNIYYLRTKIIIALYLGAKQRMKNKEHKNWWLIIPVMLILPFGINWLINQSTPSWWSSGVAGEGKDWLLFWGAYISSIATAIMAFLTYRIIKQNDDVRQGVIAIRVSYDSSMYCLELMNVGNSAASIIQMNFNENFLKLLTEQTTRTIRTISKSKIYLKPNESKFIVISYIHAGDYQEFDPETRQMKNVTITDDELKQIETTPIEIQGGYQTIGKTVQIKERFCLGEWTGLFLTQKTVIGELSGISKRLASLRSADPMGKIR